MPLALGAALHDHGPGRHEPRVVNTPTTASPKGVFSMLKNRFQPSASWILPAALFLGACSPACTPPAKGPAAAKASEKNAAALPAGAVTSAPGVDLSKLSEAQKKTFFSIINSEPSACGKAHSMATSINEDKSCRDSLQIAKFIAVSLANGTGETQLKGVAGYLADNLKPKEIDNTGRPVFGNANAPVTVTVFADFQCPHCAQEAPKVRKAVQGFNGKAKLVYRHFPLPNHDLARKAAIASEAALEQGKFWAYHDLVFAKQAELSEDKLVTYAKQIGLDMDKFNAHYKALKGETMVEKDKALGVKLEITGTPAVFVNGRLFSPALFGGSVEGWIDDALRRSQDAGAAKVK